MEIKTKKSFKNLIESLAEELLDEMSSTDNIDGYNTPFAFGGDSSNGKAKKKRISTNSTGYDIVKETLDNKDLKQITKLIKNVVGDILRDIWIKRSVWKQTKS